MRLLSFLTQVEATFSMLRPEDGPGGRRRVNYQTGGFTTLLKIDPDFTAPVHRHLGAAEAYIIEGGFYYDEGDKGMAGDYTYEAGGITHEPYSTDGCIMFAIVHGPNVGLDENGNPNFAIDATMMMEIARANNVHAHVIEIGRKS